MEEQSSNFEVILRGAEAEIIKKDGRILKKRIKKGYRDPALDKRLREDRTKLEAKFLDKAGLAGVQTPTVLSKRKFELEIEFVDGKKVKDIFEERKDLWEKIGENIARLHSKNIIHGDLTTSNIIEKGNEIYFIDFGLSYHSQRIEDRATDLHLLKQVLKSSHHRVYKKAFSKVLEGYKRVYNNSNPVFERLKDIEKRGRYK